MTREFFKVFSIVFLVLTLAFILILLLALPSEEPWGDNSSVGVFGNSRELYKSLENCPTRNPHCVTPEVPITEDSITEDPVTEDPVTANPITRVPVTSVTRSGDNEEPNEMQTRRAAQVQTQQAIQSPFNPAVALMTNDSPTSPEITSSSTPDILEQISHEATPIIVQSDGTKINKEIIIGTLIILAGIVIVALLLRRL